eukprot:715035-Karenia_brevis.AAC.1
MKTACLPFQYGLSTRAGTDCVGHMLRAATGEDEHATVIAIDGIGAFDHIKRSRMLTKLMSLPQAQQILPYCRMAYCRQSQYIWRDDEGEQHVILQGDGGEQGDPLMPALFSL